MLANVFQLFQFVHGLSFFVLGTAVVLATPRVGRLEVSRRLPLLAVFGFCEAATAWDSVLASAIGRPFILPPSLAMALLGTGYWALLAFGLLTPVPLGRSIRARPTSLALILALWILGIVILAIYDVPEALLWEGRVARLGLALPGGFLALRSMRRHTFRSMDAQPLSMSTNYRIIAGAALGAFGFIAGLALPAVPIIWKQENQQATALMIVSALSTVCGIAITYGLMQTLNAMQQQIEHWIEGVEQSLALATDRERIGRELHDGIIQSIYAAGLILEGVRQMISEDPAVAREQLSRVLVNLNQTIQDIRRYIFDLRGGVPETDLVKGLEALLRDFRVNTLLATKLIIKGQEHHPIGAEQRRHIFQIVREALSNVARHARARNVEIRLSYKPDTLQLEVADDGVGLTVAPPSSGQGLRNISERTRMLEGTLDIDSALDQGVTLTLTIPYL